MLSVLAPKNLKGNSNIKDIYSARWINVDNRTEKRWFKFSIVADDNVNEEDYKNLSVIQGKMTIRTKSTIPFKKDDIIMFRGDMFTVENIDGNRKEQGEMAFMFVNNNGNIPIYLNLRRAK